MAAAATYPKRPKFFAYRFCRLMAKVCLANEIGTDGCWMLTVIAQLEDAKGYRGAVTFFNEQLSPLVGLGSVDALARTRAKAVAAGWLNYQPGGRGRAGRYWVVIPEQFSSFDTGLTDERADHYIADSSAEMRNQPDLILRTNAEESAEITARQPRGNRGDNREETAEHSSLSQRHLALAQEGKRQTDPAERPDEEGLTLKNGVHRPASFAEFSAAWHAAGLPPRDKPPTGSNSRRSLWTQRCYDDAWRENWAAAVDRAGRSRLCRGETDKQFFTIDWFLKNPDAVVQLLEGQMDDPPDRPTVRPPPASAHGSTNGKSKIEAAADEAFRMVEDRQRRLEEHTRGQS